MKRLLPIPDLTLVPASPVAVMPTLAAIAAYWARGRVNGDDVAATAARLHLNDFQRHRPRDAEQHERLMKIKIFVASIQDKEGCNKREALGRLLDHNGVNDPEMRHFLWQEISKR